MKDKGMWLLIAFLLFVWAVSVEAQAFSEVRFQGIFAREIARYADADLENTFNLSRDGVLKEIGVSTILNGPYRLKYAVILPNSRTGVGVLTKQLIINGYTFGPKDEKDTQGKPVTMSTSAQTHRFELELMQYMPTVCQPRFSLEYLTKSIQVTGKPTDSGQQGTSSPDMVEAKDTFSKLLFGLGVTGYQRQNQFLFKYEVAYTFADKGWFVDLGGRYDSNACFVDAGWRLERHNFGPWETEYQGPYVSAGLKF